MLDYGAKAQKVFEINTGALANECVNVSTDDVDDSAIDTAISAVQTPD